MNRDYLQADYHTVSRPRSPQPAINTREKTSSRLLAAVRVGKGTSESTARQSVSAEDNSLKRGHFLSFLALFLFTIVLYARPAEFYPSAVTNSLALVIGLITLVAFAVSQLALEGTLTARPTEVNLVLLFVLTALLSIPLAISPAIAWSDFNGTFIRAVLVFIVIINVVRTEARLKALLLVALITAVLLSVGAINEYRLGLMTIEGYRVAGRGTGLFGNTNDMALHLVTMLPVSIGFFFGSRGVLKKAVFALCAALMIFGILLSYSRGAFLGLVLGLGFLSFKLARRSRVAVAVAVTFATLALLLMAPSGYGTRLLSMFVPGLDPGGSADARRGEFIRSAYVAIRHPLLGIGMGNYQPLMSLKGLVTHNSYTQVASELGMTALVLYTMFIVRPLRRLSVILRETAGLKQDSHFYYLALGLQASLLMFMISSFFLSVAFTWNVYYLVGYAVAFRRIYEAHTEKEITIGKRCAAPPDSALISTQPATA